ncbi:hypothetical protein E4634_02815 [Mangrovimicrobium sediminis]|uniref:Uncharacterized protein n=1 Tax=Mangrovimicrobium sediminis TaxID=2562682 RepID=A0A4Z0M8V6_9GAMM|nr:hypothetical protein [Haliea sp. SAOS-164]TGD75816.1 hypothetical protein E4634_02815 [Haliea sp. SAOS-164]
MRRANRIRDGWVHPLVLALALTLAGCKVEVAVPPGGQVITESGAHSCARERICSIDVVDQYFAETFIAVPHANNSFLGWAAGDNALCGNSRKPCTLVTAGFADQPELMALLESDAVFTLTPRFLVNPRLGRGDLRDDGRALPAVGNYNLLGSLGLDADAPAERLLTAADIDLRFDASGELLSLSGSAVLPEQVTDYIGILSTTRAQVGTYTGAEINAIEDIRIRLIDERQYLLFYLSSGVQMEVGDRAGGSAVVNVQPPLGGSVVFILDPVDEMLYRFGSFLGEVRGEAESDQGLLPFVPLAGLPGPIPFYAHRYQTGEKSVGIKVFDVLNFSGDFLVREPSFADIDLADPFNSEVGYFAGFNGHAQVAFGILGVGLFDFDLAEASANYDVQPLQPAEKQRLSLYARIAPDVSWQPDWLPILPQTELQAAFTANAAGELSGKFAGGYRSFLPEASLEGKLRFDNSSLTLEARVADADMDFPVQVSFRDGETHASVGLDEPIGGYVRGRMNDAFDDVDRQIADARSELEAAVADYEFELSLRGLREAIPGITSNAISALQAVPDQVYSSVRSQVRDEINRRRYCVLGVCTPSDSKRDSIASSAASSARSQARSAIAPYVDALEELRRRAAQEDDDTVRAALREALYAVYDRRHIDYTVKVTVNVDVVIATISVSKSYRINRDVISAGDAADILAAADNIERIPETSEEVIAAQAVVDALPLEEAVDAARQEVARGLAQIPTLSAVGYSVVDGQYSGFARFGDGSEYRVDFNVLDPLALAAGLNRLVVESIVEQ